MSQPLNQPPAPVPTPPANPPAAPPVTPPAPDPDVTELTVSHFKDDKGNYSESVAQSKLAKAVAEIKALREFKRGAEPKLTEFETWQQSQMSELEKAQAQAKAAQDQLAAQTSAAARLAAAARAGFTGADLDDAAKRLVGSTADELNADAATLFSKFGPRRPGVPDPSQGLGASGNGNQPPAGSFAATINAWRNQALGKNE